MLLLGGTGGEALGDGTALTVLDGAGADDTLVDGAGDAHAGLHVELGESEALVVDGGVLGDVAGGRLIEHVADDEALDGLVLGGEAAAVGAVGGGGAATRVLGTAVISTLAGHFFFLVFFVFFLRFFSYFALYEQKRENNFHTFSKVFFCV